MLLMYCVLRIIDPLGTGLAIGGGTTKALT
jgi:hypothetical protein